MAQDLDGCFQIRVAERLPGNTYAANDASLQNLQNPVSSVPFWGHDSTTWRIGPGRAQLRRRRNVLHSAAFVNIVVGVVNAVNVRKKRVQNRVKCPYLTVHVSICRLTFRLDCWPEVKLTENFHPALGYGCLLMFCVVKIQGVQPRLDGGMMTGSPRLIVPQQ